MVFGGLVQCEGEKVPVYSVVQTLAGGKKLRERAAENRRTTEAAGRSSPGPVIIKCRGKSLKNQQEP